MNRTNKSNGLTKEEYVQKMKNKNEDKEKSSKNKKNKKENTLKRKIIKIILIVILICIIVLVVTTIISMVKFTSLAKEMIQNMPSTVLDIDGNEVVQIGTERNRENISNIPDNLKNAYIAIEDQRYYSHFGIDIKRTAAATVSYIKNLGSSSFGGSTITQQLVKNLTGNTDSTIARKIDEWTKAIALEVVLSKDEILEAYLNIIYVGPNVYGVEMGAKYYFNKSATELSLAECAYLAGINNSPNSYNPFKEEDNSEKIKNRTLTVLSKMEELRIHNRRRIRNSKARGRKWFKFSKRRYRYYKHGYLFILYRCFNI